MLRVLYNENSDADVTLKIKIDRLFLRVEAKSGKDEMMGADAVEVLQPYHSYALIEKRGVVKTYRTISSSDYKLIDLNRLGVANKLDFSDLQQLYAARGILQVDTGMVCAGERDIVIRVFMGQRDNISIDADLDYEVLPFHSDILPVTEHPRMTLWDSYSLSVNGRELKANRKGSIVEGVFDEPIILGDKDYVDFSVQKYKGAFAGALARDMDDDEVLVESTCGALSTRRVYLDRGVGYFRLYPLGHTGRFKIKLGRKWYEVWNEYNLLMGGGT